jgi:hypothetical protein
VEKEVALPTTASSHFPQTCTETLLYRCLPDKSMACPLVYKLSANIFKNRFFWNWVWQLSAHDHGH